MNVHARNGLGETPLIIAAAVANLEAMAYLLANGSDALEHRDHAGNTALLRAAQSGAFEAVKFLIGAGANVHASNAIGDTGLHLALRGPEREVQVLLDAGANVNSENKRGHTPLGILLDEYFASRRMFEEMLGQNVPLPLGLQGAANYFRLLSASADDVGGRHHPSPSDRLRRMYRMRQEGLPMSSASVDDTLSISSILAGLLLQYGVETSPSDELYAEGALTDLSPADPVRKGVEEAMRLRRPTK
jgi:hypothetical protein